MSSTACAQSDGGSRVLIAGGGIMGLSLALMLERKGVDYVLLEAREEIAPPVGASVAFFANAARILDQLGLLDDFLQPSMLAVSLTDWWPSGTSNGHHEHLSDVIEAATGYPAFGLDRQQAMQILYRHVRDKSKILTGTCRVLPPPQHWTGTLRTYTPPR
jgi:2-polyprenyl-6-methoxyphenol hydroxylase-like FAD-dependent oxidoreductase